MFPADERSSRVGPRLAMVWIAEENLFDDQAAVQRLEFRGDPGTEHTGSVDQCNFRFLGGHPGVARLI